LQLAKKVQAGQNMAAIQAIQGKKTGTQTPKAQNHPISQKECQWWQKKHQQIVTQGAIMLQSVKVGKAPKARAQKMTQIQRTAANINATSKNSTLA